MQVTVRLFARLRDIAGLSELSMELPDKSTARELWEKLAADYTGLNEYRDIVSIAINAEYAKMDGTLSDGDEVAFLPPVSGG